MSEIEGVWVLVLMVVLFVCFIGAGMEEMSDRRGMQDRLRRIIANSKKE